MIIVHNANIDKGLHATDCNTKDMHLQEEEEDDN